MTMTWEVTAVDAGTRVDIVAEDVPDGISAEDHAAGRLFPGETRRLGGALALDLGARVRHRPYLVRHRGTAGHVEHSGHESRVAVGDVSMAWRDPAMLALLPLHKHR